MGVIWEDVVNLMNRRVAVCSLMTHWQQVPVGIGWLVPIPGDEMSEN